MYGREDEEMQARMAGKMQGGMDGWTHAAVRLDELDSNMSTLNRVAISNIPHPFWMCLAVRSRGMFSKKGRLH